MPSMDRMRKQREEDALRRAEQDRVERRKKEAIEHRRQMEEHERRRWDEMAQAKMLAKKSDELEEAAAKQEAFLKAIEEKQYGSGNSACPRPNPPSTPTPDLMGPDD
jgi:dTMP kinase